MTTLNTQSARERLLALMAARQVESTEQPSPQPVELELPPITKLSADAPIPLSPAQEGLWVLEQLLEPSGLYNIVRATQLDGALDLQAMRSGLQRIVARHDSLRSRIRSTAAGPQVEVTPAVDAQLSVVDVGPLEGQALQQAVAEVAAQPLDISGGMPWRFVLFRRSETSHVLLLVVHHLFGDGWSMANLAKELAHHYRYATGSNSNNDNSLPPLRLQFSDCAAWLNQEQQRHKSRELSYWSQRLKGLTPLELPTDRPRPARLGHQGDWIGFQVPASIRERVHALASAKGLTPFMVLLAAFKVLLRRLASQTDVVVGTPVAGRSRPEFDEQIGYFVNSVVLRTELDGNPSFEAALERVRQTTLDAFDHQDLSFERLVAHLSPERDGSRNPLFQVYFSLQSTLKDTLVLDGLQSQRVPVPVRNAKFDLSLEFIEDKNTLFGAFEFNTELFDAQTIERWQDHFLTLLDAVLVQPSRAIDEAPLLTDVQATRILQDWNNTWQSYSLQNSLQHWVERQVAASPNAPAVILDDQVLDYATLNAKANAVAHQLRAHGVKPDTIVGVCMERSFELLIGLLGVLKAGGAFMPMDPELPSDRLAFMLEDAETTVILTQTHLHAQVMQVRGERPLSVLSLDWRSLSVDGESGQNPVDLNRIDDLSYAIFTSGSTGRPKGALNTHRGLVNHVLWLKDALRLAPQDRVAHKTTISFDAAIWEIFTPLVCGASIVLARPGVHRDMQALTAFVIDQDVTVLQMVPSALRVLLSEPRITDCKRLRYVVSGGEALEATLAHQFHDTLPHTVLGNFYGPSEASDDATWFELQRGVPLRPIVPIGRPIGNVRCHVLDGLRQLVPIGVVGELFVGGVSVGRGYLKRPEMTAEKFVDDPFFPGQKLYRTGDLARHLPDGTIEYLGRMDHQVKIRGQRVELGEIEAQLKACEGVTHSAVLLREDRPGHPMLVAYVVADPSVMPGLKAKLAQQLPSHMVPSIVVRMDELPTLPNGKLDRKSLPAPNHHEAQVSATPARTPLEADLMAIWADVLGCDHFGIHDNFFDLGGHSLGATRIASRVRSQLHVDMPLRWLFESPTVAELATRVEVSSRTPDDAAPRWPLSAPQDRPRQRQAPVSFAQRQMWLLQQRSPQSTAYNMSAAFRLTGAVHREYLAQALQDVLDHHEAFRTRFVMTGDEPIQVIDAHARCLLERLDGEALTAAEREPQLWRWLNERVRQPFDLSQAPLSRVTLVSLGAEEVALQVVMHHAIADAWSLNLFLQQVEARYAQVAAAQDRTPLPSMAPVAVEYADYATWQRERLQVTALDHLWSYWESQLSGLRPMALPYDRPAPVDRLGEGGRIYRSIPQQTLQRLQEYGLTRGLTPTMTLMAALGVQLRALSGQDDVVIGTPVAQRSAVELERVLGVLINPVLLRLELSGSSSFHAVTQHVREVALGAYAHQDMPFEELDLRLRRTGRSVAEAMQVLLTVLPGADQPFSGQGLVCEALAPKSCSAQVDLSFQFALDETRQVSLTFAKDVIDEVTAARWLDDYLALLDNLLTDPASHLDARTVGAHSLDKQLALWNNTAVPFRDKVSVAALLSLQSHKTPQAPALVDGPHRLSYAELEARANQLARAIRAAGVARGGLVGLCVSRSTPMCVAQWAILKSGAAYVPLDPAYPAHRLAHMAEDAQLALLITESSLASVMNWPRQRSLWLDQDAALIESQPTEPLAADTERDARPEDPAYVIYTSGSTGKPKGVVVPHRAVVNFLESMEREPGLLASDRLVAVTTLSFDIHVLELLLPSAVGAQIVIASRDTAMDGRALAELLRSTDATVMQATPSTWRLLIDAGWQGHAQFKALVGGEPLPRDLAQALLSRVGSLWNMYGPTETTVWSTCCRVESIDHGITVGRPIANTQIHILDQQLKPRPLGAVGEICIGGAGVTSGYLNRPELTAAKFVSLNPEAPNAAWVYRTGDLGRWRNDETIEHLGRMDSQVKVRGYRIELGEIETALASHPQVAQAVVSVYEPQAGDVRLVAYLVARHALPSFGDVRSHLAQSLPEHMLPHHVVGIPSVPLLPNGKVDRQALPPPAVEATAQPVNNAYANGLNELEQSVALIWQQCLKLPHLPGPDQTFQDLGGHSLLAAKLVRSIEQALGRPCSMQQLFRGNTIRLLCQALEQQSPESASAEVVPLSLDLSKPTVFCICGIYLYKPLADSLASHYSVYGIFLPYEKRLLAIDESEGSPTLPSVERMAADYVDAILTRQPQGPYRLAGVSFGGVIAYEIAQQLSRLGHSVEWVGLFDSMLAGAVREKRVLSLIRRTWRALRPTTADASNRPKATADANTLVDQQVADRRETIYKQAIALYQPRSYAGRVVLIRAKEERVRLDQALDPTYGWSPHVPDLQVIDVGGDHLSHLQPPHVQEVAAQLIEKLAARG